jgi:hypothetical protein
VNIIPSNGITILDSTMEKNEIRIIKSLSEVLGFEIKNETGKHLYVEVEWDYSSKASEVYSIKKLIIRQ